MFISSSFYGEWNLAYPRERWRRHSYEGGYVVIGDIRAEVEFNYQQSSSNIHTAEIPHDETGLSNGSE
jgi:hypothetical protein